MSITYTPTTNFGSKDSLPSNDPNKVIKGSEFTTEFSAIQSAFGLAAPTSNPTFTGTATFDDISANTISLTDVDIVNLDVTGTATLADADVVTLDVTGTSTLADADVVTLDVTGTSTLADADVVTLDVTGTATLADADVTTLDVTGATNLVDLTATGTATLTDADVDVLDVTGTATLADADVTTLDVTGSFTSVGIDDNATSTAITIDADENVGIGTTPESWSTYTPIQVQQSSLSSFTNGDARLTNNAYYNNGWKYIDSNSATQYLMDAGNGVHTWSTASAGTAGGAVTWSEKMRIDSSGFVTVTGGAAAGTSTTSISGSTTLDFSAQQNFVLTLTGNVTLVNPTTETVGQSGFIVFIQDATGGRTVSLGTEYETANSDGLTLSTAASTTDIVPYVVAASGRILLGAPQLAFG